MTNMNRRPKTRATDGGLYVPNHFLITLGGDQLYILGSDEVDSRYYHIFMHEYWHYLQNVTTVSGFRSFAHLNEVDAEFTPSKFVSAPCPFFNECPHDYRRSHAQICGSSPWFAFSGLDVGCWYSVAVQGTAGLVSIRKKATSP